MAPAQDIAPARDSSEGVKFVQAGRTASLTRSNGSMRPSVRPQYTSEKTDAMELTLHVDKGSYCPRDVVTGTVYLRVGPGLHHHVTEGSFVLRVYRHLIWKPSSILCSEEFPDEARCGHVCSGSKRRGSLLPPPSYHHWLGRVQLYPKV